MRSNVSFHIFSIAGLIKGSIKGDFSSGIMPVGDVIADIVSEQTSKAPLTTSHKSSTSLPFILSFTDFACLISLYIRYDNATTVIATEAALSPCGSIRKIGFPSQNAYRFRPPLRPMGSFESQRPVTGSYHRMRKLTRPVAAERVVPNRDGRRAVRIGRVRERAPPVVGVGRVFTIPQ